MKATSNLGRGIAVLACAASLAGTAAVVAPAAASAKAGTSCANKVLSVKPEGNPVIHIPVKAVSVEGGVTCAEAYKLIQGVLEAKLPSGWHSGIGKFEAPEGLIPSEIKKGSKRVKYAVRGG